MPTITGKLIGIDLAATPQGTIEFMLCGYGSQFPRGIGAGGEVGSICTPETEAVISAPGAAFSVQLVGNDTIAPAGTYYTATIKDANGDVVQCNAYIFLDSHGDYDLEFEQPFDPTQPPPPLPPRIVSQLLIIPPSATPNFPGDQFTAWGFNLTQDVTSSTMSGIVAGNLYTFIITNSNGGGWKFKWPVLVLDATEVNPSNAGITVQTFVAIANGGPLLPIGAGAWYP